MRASAREIVSRRAGNRCEYCLCPIYLSTSPFDIEHIHPESRGGGDELDNLAWACSGCNGSKGTAISARDPETGEAAPLYNPRTHRWKEHFRWNVSLEFIEGKTPTGRATIRRLDLNREGVVNVRNVLKDHHTHPAYDAEGPAGWNESERSNSDVG